MDHDKSGSQLCDSIHLVWLNLATQPLSIQWGKSQGLWYGLFPYGLEPQTFPFIARRNTKLQPVVYRFNHWLPSDLQRLTSSRWEFPPRCVLESSRRHLARPRLNHTPTALRDTGLCSVASCRRTDITYTSLPLHTAKISKFKWHDAAIDYRNTHFCVVVLKMLNFYIFHATLVYIVNKSSKIP